MSLTARVQPAFIAQQAAQCRPRVETGPKIARALGNDEEIPISPSVGPTDLHMPTAIVDGRHVAVRYQDLDSVGDVHSGARVHAATPTATALICSMSRSVRAMPKRAMYELISAGHGGRAV